MKIEELMEKQEPNGTYAAVTFNGKTIDNIEKFIKDNNIPNPIDSNELHCTLLYSRKHLPDYKAYGTLSENMVGKFKEFELWPSGSEGKKCLVATFTCKALSERHEELMKEHGATYDYDEYKPHTTLSYDVGDLDLEDVPKFEHDIVIVKEYSEDLD